VLQSHNARRPAAGITATLHSTAAHTTPGSRHLPQCLVLHLGLTIPVKILIPGFRYFLIYETGIPVLMPALQRQTARHSPGKAVGCLLRLVLVISMSRPAATHCCCKTTSLTEKYFYIFITQQSLKLFFNMQYLHFLCAQQSVQ
jgi:hypothetical protein